MPSNFDRLGERREADPTLADQERQLREVKSDNARLERAIAEKNVKLAALIKDHSAGRGLGHLFDALAVVLMLASIVGTSFFDWHVSLVLAGSAFCCGCSVAGSDFRRRSAHQQARWCEARERDESLAVSPHNATAAVLRNYRGYHPGVGAGPRVETSAAWRPVARRSGSDCPARAGRRCFTWRSSSWPAE